MGAATVTVTKEVCPVCRTESANFDPTTGMFLCNKCGELFEPGDAGTVKQKKRKKEKKDEEDYGDGDEMQNYEEEDLNLFTCIITAIGVLIPGVNLVLAYILGSSNVKKEYQKSIMSFFVIAVMIHLSIFYFVAFKLKQDGGEMLINNLNKISQNVATDWSISRLYDIEFREVNPIIKSPLDDIEPIIPIADDNEEELMVKEEDFLYIENSVQPGAIVYDLAKKYSECETTILVRTKDMEARYEEQYRNFGLLLSGCEKNSNGNYFIDYKIYNSYWLDDYNEMKSVGFDDLFNTKYIFCIKQSNQYLIELIRSSDGDVLGIKITEVEVK